MNVDYFRLSAQWLRLTRAPLVPTPSGLAFADKRNPASRDHEGAVDTTLLLEMRFHKLSAVSLVDFSTLTRGCRSSVGSFGCWELPILS